MIADMLDLEQLVAAVEREAKAASAPQADYETPRERGDEQALADAQSGGVPHELLEYHQSARRLNQGCPAEVASIAEQQRPITLNQGGQFSAEPGAAPEHPKVTGQESPDILDLEQLLAAVEREANAAFAPQTDYETMSGRGDEHTLADEQSGEVPHELLEHHQSTRRVNQASPVNGASIAEKQRPITLNQGGQLAAEPGAAPEPPKVTGQESPKNHSDQTGLTFEDRFRQLAGTLFDDGGSKPADTTAELQGSAGLNLNDAATKGAGNLTQERCEDTGHDEGGPMRLPPAATLPPLTTECGENPAKQDQRHLGLTQDDIASATLTLAAPAQPDNCPVSTVEPVCRLPESLTQKLSDSVPISPVKHTRRRLAYLLLATVLFCTFVLPIAPDGVDKVDNTKLAQVTHSPSKSATAEPPMPMRQPANAIGSAQQVEGAPRMVPPAAAVSRGESSGSNAALVSGRHEPVAQQERTADLSEAKATAKLVDRGMESLPSGDIELARVSQRRSVKAIPGTAAVPSQGETSPSMPLRGTSQALAVEQPGKQNEHSPQITSSSHARHSAQVARVEPGVAAGSGQVAYTRPLGSDEIAILLGRGMESLKSCNLEPAWLSLRRAVKANSGTAAVASQGEPSRPMPLRGTSQAPAVPQHEHSPQITSSSDAKHSVAQVAKLEPGVAPGSGQMAPAQKNSTIRHLDPDEIAILLSRGMDFLNSGDFASARVTLRRAAEAGNAEAAVALGKTYDPSVLRQLGAVGIAADIAEAREWYEKAANFGSATAAQRLARLRQLTH